MIAPLRCSSALLALIVLINSVWCACASAGTFAATTQPAEPPCCQKSVAAERLASSNRPQPPADSDHDCPHCRQSQNAAQSVPATPKPPAAINLPWHTDFDAFAFNVPTALPRVSVRSAVLALRTPLPLRLHCALTL